jgi:hypothetical protein
MSIRNLEKSLRRRLVRIARSSKEDNRGQQADAANSHSATRPAFRLTA